MSTTILMAGPVLSLSFLAWLGVLKSRELWVGRILQLFLIWLTCMPVSLVLYNCTRLFKYLPRTFDAWARAAATPSWWGWVLGKVFCGATDLLCILFAVLWYATMSWMAWPFRYFYYYRTTVFSSDLYSTDVFILNMLQHTGMLVGWLLCLHILAFGVSRSISSLSILKKYWPHATFFVAASSVVCVIRVFWFLFANFFTVSFWASWVIFSFSHVHILAIFSYLPLSTALLQKDSTSFHIRESFVQSFVGTHLSAQQSCDGSNSDKETETLRAEANIIFDELLDVACTKFVFQERTEKTDSIRAEDDDAAKAKDPEAVAFLDQVLSTIDGASKIYASNSTKDD